MRDYSLEKNLRVLLKRTERMESSIKSITDSVAKNREENAWTGMAVAYLTLRVDEIGRALNDWEWSQEVRTSMTQVLQTAVFLTTLSFAVWGIGIAIGNSDMQMLGMLGLAPSSILILTHFFQVRRHDKYVAEIAQEIKADSVPMTKFWDITRRPDGPR